MSSEYFCKVALARSSSRSSRQLNKQANAAMKLKKAITGPLGGMLAGAGLAGGVGLRSIRGLQQELAAKAVTEANNMATIGRLNKMVRELHAPNLGQSKSEQVVDALAEANRGASDLANQVFTSDATTKVLNSLMKAREYAGTSANNAVNAVTDYASGAANRLAETLQGHPFF